MGTSLLRYCLYGTVPASAPIPEQVQNLTSLASSLTLDGYEVDTPGQFNERLVPMVIRRGKKSSAFETYPTLLNPLAIAESWAENGFYCSEVDVRSDLPGVHAKIRKMLPSLQVRDLAVQPSLLFHAERRRDHQPILRRVRVCPAKSSTALLIALTATFWWVRRKETKNSRDAH